MTETHGANSLAKIAHPFVVNIERIHADLESLKGEYMAKCKGRREEIKAVYSLAKDKGVAKRPLQGIVRKRTLERKIDKIANDFDIDESATYRELCEGLGPLGQAAAVRAGYGTVVDGDINKLGRGPLDNQNPVDALA